MIAENVQKEILVKMSKDDKGFQYDEICSLVEEYATKIEDDSDNSVMKFTFSDDSCMTISFYEELVNVYGASE